MAPITSLHRPSRDHHHETSLDDTFDFLNTLELESGFLVDRLESFGHAAAWFVEHRLVHDDLAAPRRSTDEQAALERVRAVRGALREVAHAVTEERPPESSAIAEVNRAIAARERIELVASPEGVSVGHSHVGDPVDDALARLADPLVREISVGNAERVRICANDTCRWVFFDESRAGRRRWCDMATCGNRAKAARHRARQKARETMPGAATPSEATPGGPRCSSRGQ